MMPEVPVDEVVTDPVEAPEEEPRDSGMNLDSPIGTTSFFCFLCFFFLSVTWFANTFLAS